MGRTIIEGWWCDNCEFFESEDDIDTTIDACRACGCSANSHTPVEIVTRGLV